MAIEPAESFVLANGLRHHVLTWNPGGAPTVVCAHGFLDLAWSFHWLAQELIAQSNLRIVAFDWRGHGETEHIGRGGYYHFPDYMLDLRELWPQIAPRGAHLVGHSMGGTACTYYAGTRPSGLLSLTAIEGLGPPEMDGEAPDRALAWLGSVERLRQRPARPLADLSEAVKRLRAQNSELPAERAYVLADKGTVRAADGDGLHWRFDPLHRTTSPIPFSRAAFMQFLKRIEVRALIVSGERGIRTVDHAERVAAIEDAREVEIPAVGHMVHQIAPEPLAAAIAEHVGRG